MVDAAVRWRWTRVDWEAVGAASGGCGVRASGLEARNEARGVTMEGTVNPRYLRSPPRIDEEGEAAANSCTMDRNKVKMRH